MRRKFSIVAVLALTLLALVGGPVSAQSRSVFWRTWDVVIDEVDTVANEFNVTELYDV